VPPRRICQSKSGDQDREYGVLAQEGIKGRNRVRGDEQMT
jgi:hypothetical protein